MTRLNLCCHQHARANSTSIEYPSIEWVQARKVAVSSALLGTPEVLILDEPTNHMDVQVCSSRSHSQSTQNGTVLSRPCTK